MNHLFFYKAWFQRHSRPGAWLLCFLTGLWLTGCLESLDPQLTPVITSVSPDTTTYGATVKVRGYNFSFLNAATTVTLVIEGSADTLMVTSLDIRKNDAGENEINVYIPDLAAGDYQLFLLVKDRAGDRRSNEVPLKLLTFGPTGLEPDRGPAGTTVTIRGNGLKGTQKLLFRRPLSSLPIEVAPLETPTDSEVKVVVPEGAAPGPIRMVFKDIALEPETPEFRVTLPPPTVTSLTPDKGPVGTKLVIKGTHLGLGNVFARKVTFEGKDGKPVSASIIEGESNDTQITVNVPGDAVTGPVKVEIDEVAAKGNLHFTVVVPVASKQLFWVDAATNTIQQATIGTEKPLTVNIAKLYESTQPDHALTNLAIDRENQRLYFFGMNNTSFKTFLKSVDLRGGSERTILAETEGMVNSLKVAGGHLYWVEDNLKIYRANLNGSNRTLLYEETEGGGVYSLEVAQREDFVYWSGYDANFSNVVKRRAANGSSQVTTLFEAAELTDGSSIDLSDLEVFENQLFLPGYDPAYNGIVLTGKADGSGTLRIATEFGFLQPNYFEVDDREGKFYWIRFDPALFTGEMYRSELNGSQPEALFKADLAEYPSIPTGSFDVF